MNRPKLVIVSFEGGVHIFINGVDYGPHIKEFTYQVKASGIENHPEQTFDAKFDIETLRHDGETFEELYSRLEKTGLWEHGTENE